MKISEEQQDAMLEAAKPLMRWLAENCHPHCQCVVCAVSAELTEGVARVVTYEFIEAKEQPHG